MSVKHQTTAAEAYEQCVHPNGNFETERSSFVCPHCRAFSSHTWGKVASVQLVTRANGLGTGRSLSGASLVVTALCVACNQESVFVDNQLVYPKENDGFVPHHDMPIEIRDDYIEAANILRYSPRGSAALLRLAVQKLLPLIGATEKDINAQIGELVAKGTLTGVVQKALDSLRVIGNEAVHPGTMDLTDDRRTASSLFTLLNFIVEKSISEPKLVNEIFAGLPEAKLKGIEVRDSKFAGS
jgi:Domain of unknown function (DUF4145)